MTAQALPSSWLGRWRFALRRARTGAPGDFALLKADLLGARATPAVEAKLDAMRGYRPKIDLAALAKLPGDTFGKAYSDWMLGRQLTPIEVSDDLADIADRNAFALRYAVTHDMVHVLTGFDTSWAGEMGVLAFAVGQGYSRSQSVSLGIATLLYPVLSPWTAGRILGARRQGLAMGGAAECVLADRLEARFDDRLDDVRAALGITPV